MTYRVKVSERGSGAPSSPIRKLVPLADGAKSKGRHVYHLNIGQPDIPTPEPMLHAAQEYKGPVLSYGPSGGLPEFINALAGYYESCAISLRKNQILATTAASEALLFALAAVTDPGDQVLIPDPLYANYLGFASILGVTVTPAVCSPEDGYKIPPPEILDKLCGPRCKAMLLCNPGNPTGRVTSSDELRAIGDWAKARNIFLIGDECYREFCYEGSAPPSVLNLEGCEDLTIMTDSISKRFSACGARVGCLVSRNEEVMATVMKFAQARLCPPTLGQLMGIKAFTETPPSYYQKIIDTYRERRDLLCEKLSEMPGVSYRKPEGAFYIMATLPVSDSEDFTRWMLTDFHLNNKTVMVAPGAGFYATKGLGAKEVRIAYVLELVHLETAMKVLAAGLRAFSDR
ncbi:MAG: pyridoxal phosphate-dependent aminotransferase [Candidatus Eisenbacteria bacterium]|nr:pyridoxal phosphate-dependent aminotransferase [Candidatus Eisenbacteria bacterium]